MLFLTITDLQGEIIYLFLRHMETFYVYSVSTHKPFLAKPLHGK